MTRNGRNPSDLRKVEIESDVNPFAEGSALIKFGQTHVLCTASVESKVPEWMEGKGRGWVTAEYSMLPRSTHTRTKRERGKVSGRSQEIQRLIGRSLRSVTDLEALGEQMIVVDCDVLQADGGTRTAAITGGYVALALALRKLPNLDASKVLPHSVAAVSVGVIDGEPRLDLDYEEDSGCEVDMNFVITSQGEFVEIQGTGEKRAFTESEFQKMTALARAGASQLTEIQRACLS